MLIIIIWMDSGVYIVRTIWIKRYKIRFEKNHKKLPSSINFSKQMKKSAIVKKCLILF